MPDQPPSRQKAKAGRDANVAGRDINNYYGSTEPTVPGLLPRDVHAFTGREGELARITALATEGRVVVSAIGGTPGVGKTAFAVHAAHRLLGQFPGGHLYADLRGYTEGQNPAQPDEALQVFLRSLGVPAEDIPVAMEERSGLLRQQLANRRVLMVLDNARTEAQVRPLLPGVGESLILVTSRSVLPGLEVDERISLDILPTDEATAMLGRVIGTTRAEAEPQAVAEVLTLCARLPLALQIAGQLLATHPRWPVARLAQLLVDEQGRLAVLGANDSQVRTAFKVSYEQLTPADKRLFRMLGLHPGPEFTVPIAAALTGTEPEEASPALDRLAGAHLVTELAFGRFGMHDLLRLFAREKCQETDSQAELDNAEARLVDYYVALARFLHICANPQLRSAAAEEGWGTLPSIRDALAEFQSERPGLVAVVGLAAHRYLAEEVQLLNYDVTYPLALLRYLDDLITVHEAALAAARHTGNREHEGGALAHLGNVHQEMGRFDEAIDYYQQALVIFRETRYPRGEGLTMDSIGRLHQDMGQLKEAFDYYQQALVIFRKIGDRQGEGEALGNVGNVTRELGRFEEAIDCHQQALVIFRETSNRHAEGLALANLGGIHRELQRLEEALDYHQQALAIHRETGDRLGEGQVLNNLGNAYHDLRQPDRSIAYWREAAAAMRDTGEQDQAERLERLAASTATRPRRRWLRLRRQGSF